MPGGRMSDARVESWNDHVVTSEVLSDSGMIVIVEGDLDLATAPQLHAEVSGGVTRGYRRFVIDLTQAEFLGSVAMGTLLVAIEPLREESDAAVVLAGSHGIVGRALQVS